MRAALLSLEKSYQRLEIERGIVLAGCLDAPACPGFLEFFNRAAAVERKIQLATQYFWEEQALLWKLSLPLRCELPSAISPSSFPAFHFPIIHGNKTDLLSLKTTQFLFQPSTQNFKLSIQAQNLISEATLKKEGSLHEWEVYWSK